MALEGSHLAHVSLQFAKRRLGPTSGSGVSGSGLNGRSVPALDCVENSFFFFALGCETSHALASDDRFAGSRVNDSWKDRSAMAPN
jgi:hypothetical protein